MPFGFRRVVTGHDAAGRAVFVSDGTPPRTIDEPTGLGVSDLWWLGVSPSTVDDGGDAPEGPVALEPPAGGMSARIIRLPPPAPGAADDERWVRVEGDDPTRPGMHATDTLDFLTMLDGEIVLGLDDGEHALAAGDVVVQRGTAHRWRVRGDAPCTFAVFMLRPDPFSPEPAAPMTPPATRAPAGIGPRRLVTGTLANGRSGVVSDGTAPAAFQPAGPDGVALVELWQTGGPLRRPDQGGDPDGPWELEPRGAGIAFRYVEMPPGTDSGERGWHTTNTIDLNIVVSGRVELAVPDIDPVVLGAGESVVQRGTNHKWRPIGDEPSRHVAIMLAV